VEALAAAMDAKPAEVIKYLMINMGIMATITQSVDAESAVVVAEAFGKKVVRQAQPDEDAAELAADTVALSGTLKQSTVTLSTVTYSTKVAVVPCIGCAAYVWQDEDA
jgi:adenosine/AMP kinase